MSAKMIDPRWAELVTEEMKDAVLLKATDGTITCPVLRKFAEEQGIPYRVAGAAADMAGVRVGRCDLGCF